MLNNNHSDGELMKQVAKRGELANAAFSQLVGRYSSLVLNVCHRSLLDSSEAEDAAQAVFLVLWNKAERLSRHTNVAGWLHRVSQNVCRNANRSRSTRKEHEMKAAKSRPTQARQWNDIRDVIDHELDRLPAKYRPLLILVYLQGHSIDEAAKLLDSNASTLRTQLSRARDLLRGRLLKRGIGIGAVPMCAAIKANANAHTVSAKFVASTSRLPMHAIPPTIEILAEGAMTAMTMKSISTTVATFAIAIMTIGTVFVVGVVAKEKAQQAAKIPDVKVIANGNILVIPFTTDLQRLASPSYDSADYLIEVNGRQLLGGNPNPTRKAAEEFDYGQFADEFKAIEGFEDAKVVIRVIWPIRANTVNGHVCQAHLWLMVKELCKEAVRSDQQVICFEKFDKNTWQKEVAMLSKKPTKKQIRGERSAGDNQVGVYRPLTPLSRFLYQEADCVVHLVGPLLEAELSAIKSMEKGVSKLGLEKKNRVTFLYNATRNHPVEDSVLTEELFGKRVWKDRLGFADWCRLRRI